MRNEDDLRWQARWNTSGTEPGTEDAIINADPVQLLHVLQSMNMLHMNDATRAMLRDKYPDVYAKLQAVQYEDAEKRLIALLGQ